MRSTGSVFQCHHPESYLSPFTSPSPSILLPFFRSPSFLSIKTTPTSLRLILPQLFLTNRTFFCVLHFAILNISFKNNQLLEVYRFGGGRKKPYFSLSCSTLLNNDTHCPTFFITSCYLIKGHLIQ